jgi:hypothetical protein
MGFVVLVCAIAAACLAIARPQDLSDIGGASSAGGAPRDMRIVLESALQRGHSLTLGEAEINQWLGRTLEARQGGIFSGKVTLERVLVRLEDGFAELVMERKVLGKPFTVSMFIRIEQFEGPGGLRTEVGLHGGPYGAGLARPLKGGRFGRLVVPQGFLILVMPAYRAFAQSCREEIRLAFEEMARVRIEPGRLVLDSRVPDADALLRMETHR